MTDTRDPSGYRPQNHSEPSKSFWEWVEILVRVNRVCVWRVVGTVAIVAAGAVVILAVLWTFALWPFEVPAICSGGFPPLCEYYHSWAVGYRFWRVIDFVGGFLIIVLPIVLATDISNANRRKKIAALAAVVAGLASWQNTSVKATAHEHAFLCLRELITYYASYKDKGEAEAQFLKCQNFIDYDYVEPPKSSTPAKPPAS